MRGKTGRCDEKFRLFSEVSATTLAEKMSRQLDKPH